MPTSLAHSPSRCRSSRAPPPSFSPPHTMPLHFPRGSLGAAGQAYSNAWVYTHTCFTIALATESAPGAAGGGGAAAASSAGRLSRRNNANGASAHAPRPSAAPHGTRSMPVTCGLGCCEKQKGRETD
eukprot:365737-Chlamydomonas_euryale.AAC.5